MNPEILLAHGLAGARVAGALRLVGRYALLFCWFCFGTGSLFAQETRYYSSCSSFDLYQTSQSVPTAGSPSFDENEELTRIFEDFDNPDAEIRQKSWARASDIATNTSSTQTRQRVVEEFLEKIEWNNSSNGGNYLSHILHFDESAYSARARTLLGMQVERALKDYELFPNESNRIEFHLKGLIKCIGMARATEHMALLGRIKEKFGHVFENLPETNAAIEKNVYKVLDSWLVSPAWTAVVTRARLGSKEDTLFCIDLARGFPNNQFKTLQVFRDLAHTEQPEVLQYFYDSLDSQESFEVNKEPFKSRRYVWPSALQKFLGMLNNKDLQVLEKCRQQEEVVQKIHEYVQKNAGGDPRKLPIRPYKAMPHSRQMGK